MVELFNLGISENTVKSMVELNQNIKQMPNEEIKEKEIILEKLNCSQNQIKNIISSNALYLDRTNEEVIKLINTLIKYKFNTLNILFDSNPYILNLEPFEIENYINSRINNGEVLEAIIDDLDANPYLFNDM